ncbi:type II secretion system protein [Pseudomonas alliivorans]|nr:type II secretion system protein [Pseudomonas alliivorans]MEE4816643.1 type II secretion system protein [Pseudomonas alliivorans]MEE4831791.1 type II secretion system protein [Pseudomonas alliivorans]MEE4872819.1 type II secretion system protein [Pseudomonas alliivorans]MEE4923306.1 type II secretion system protein [Pseudomonas alliivorans]
MDRAGPASRESGFTMLEMLAALTLMALCSTVLLVALGQSARSLSKVSQSDRLTHAAMSVMDEHTSEPLTPGHQQGSLGEGIEWQLNVARQPTHPGQPRMFRLDLIVTQAQREARFSTLKLQPAIEKAHL